MNIFSWRRKKHLGTYRGRDQRRPRLESLESRALLTSTILDVTEVQQFSAADADAGDQFGFATAMTNDGKIAIVGANKDDGLSNNAGAAYVYYHDGSTWSQVAKLTRSTSPPSGTPSIGRDGFGASVAVTGAAEDFTAVIGTGDLPNAFVFEGSVDATGTFVGSTEPSAVLQVNGSDKFGDRNSVGIAQQTDAQGAVVRQTVVVGDADDGSQSRGAGAVHVFENLGATWMPGSQISVIGPTLTVYSEAPSRNAGFGSAASISADGLTLAVGAWNAGEVELFERGSTGGSFNHAATIQALSGIGDLGWDVDLSGDGSTLAATTMWNAAVVNEPATGWQAWSGNPIGSESQLPESFADPANSDARFGWSIDINDDGDTIVVGVASNAEHTAFGFSTASSVNPTQGYGELARFAPMAGSTDGNLATAATNGDLVVFGNQNHDGSNGALKDSGTVHAFETPTLTPVAGITVTPVTGLQTSEDGDTATFDVVLDTQPTHDVTIALSSSDPGEGTVSPVSLTFTSANWDTAQQVTITGQDDALQDGSQTYTVMLAPASSLDTAYDQLDAADVAVTNLDNEAPSVTTVFVSDLDGSSTSSRGGKWNATVLIAVVDAASQPISGATVTGSWSNGASGAPSCTTDSHGQCSVSKNNLHKNVSSVTFTVDSIVGTDLVYDATLNSDADGDSDGTTIHISQPGANAVAAAIGSGIAEFKWLAEERLKRTSHRGNAWAARIDLVFTHPNAFLA